MVSLCCHDSKSEKTRTRFNVGSSYRHIPSRDLFPVGMAWVADCWCVYGISGIAIGESCLIRGWLSVLRLESRCLEANLEGCSIWSGLNRLPPSSRVSRDIRCSNASLNLLTVCLSVSVIYFGRRVTPMSKGANGQRPAEILEMVIRCFVWPLPTGASTNWFDSARFLRGRVT